MKPKFRDGVHEGLQDYFNEVFSRHKIETITCLALVWKAAHVHLVAHIKKELEAEGKLNDLKALRDTIGYCFNERDLCDQTFEFMAQSAAIEATCGDVWLPKQLLRLVSYDPSVDAEETYSKWRAEHNLDRDLAAQEA